MVVKYKRGVGRGSYWRGGVMMSVKKTVLTIIEEMPLWRTGFVGNSIKYRANVKCG